MLDAEDLKTNIETAAVMTSKTRSREPEAGHSGDVTESAEAQISALNSRST